MTENRRKQEPITFPDRREAVNSNGKESSLTVKWWGILLVIFTVISWLTITAIGTADRVTKLEATSTYVATSISEIKDMVKDIRKEIREQTRIRR